VNRSVILFIVWMFHRGKENPLAEIVKLSPSVAGGEHILGAGVRTDD